MKKCLHHQEFFAGFGIIPAGIPPGAFPSGFPEFSVGSGGYYLDTQSIGQAFGLVQLLLLIFYAQIK